MNTEYLTIWYLVEIRGVKTCFKTYVTNTSDNQEAIGLLKKTVKRLTGRDVLDCTTADPFRLETRAWKKYIISNRSYDRMPPKIDGWKVSEDNEQKTKAKGRPRCLVD